MSLWYGLQVTTDPLVSEFREVHRQERKWARRVMFERYRRFDIKYQPMILKAGDRVFMHPKTWEKINAQLQA